MSIARHHAEWLSLTEISGPFLSMPVLMRVFPQGLDEDDPKLRRELRLAYEEWLDNQFGLQPEAAIHHAWVRYVLEQILQLPDEVLAEGQAIPQDLKATIAEQQETLRPDLIVQSLESGTRNSEPGTLNCKLLIQIYPAGQDLNKTLAGRHWKASPATRMMALCHATGVRLGLATNGEQWLLVNAPRGETTGFITWYAELWLEEKLTLRAFRSLLGVHRFFSVAEDETLAAMLAQSQDEQHEVTDQLGYQVRRAVEVLVQAIDLADRDRGGSLLADVSEADLYEAALTIMMRLVFLFSAEERGLFPLDDDLYNQYYAASTLREQLREAADQFGEEVIERRLDAWCRLLTTFRAIHSGIEHDRLRLPAYGGSLFDPDRFPFLEGRPKRGSWLTTPADPLPINNRTVLHLLEALQLLQVKVPGGGPAEARRLSFRALDIEQIGHVYESLLDHTAVRAKGVVLGLTGSKYNEPEVPLETLEAFLVQGSEFGVQSSEPETVNPELINYLKDQTGRTENALRKALQQTNSEPGTRNAELATRNSKLRIVCGNNDALYRRVLPFAGLLREDDLGRPVVILPGSVYVTAGTERRATGTHYTPKSLTEPIVKHTLEPLVYDGPAEGKPQEKWKLRSPARLLDLKVCDMAMGSGAFLVQTCRYLSERLVEAWENSVQSSGKTVQGSKFTVHSSKQKTLNPEPGTLNPEPGTLNLITPEGEPTANPDEAIPANTDDRLIYAKRLIADRCLYGVDKNPLAVEMAKLSLWLITLDKNRAFTFLDHALKRGDSLVGVDLDQLTTWSLEGEGERRFETLTIQSQIEQMIDLRRRLEGTPVNSVADQTYKRQLFEQAEAVAHDLKQGGDMLVGSYFNDLSNNEQEYLRTALLLAFRDGQDVPPDRAEQADLGDLRPFHWPLEFPEVFLAEGRDGFDAFVGNPPFIGGKRISSVEGIIYREYIGKYIGNRVKGSADLCAFFFLRAEKLLDLGGTLGLIATNTIAQSGTRQVGLDQIVASNCTIYRAVSSRKWPGSAVLEVALVWLRRGISWNGSFILDGKAVSGITSYLTGKERIHGKPRRLAFNANKSFIGSYILGKGFILETDEAKKLLAKEPRNKDVLFPYLNGKDVNSQFDQSASRWVINFYDWSFEKARQYPECLQILTDRVKPYRDAIVAKGKQIHEYDYWKFWDKRLESYALISEMSKVLVIPRVSKYLTVSLVDVDQVFSDALVVIASETWNFFVVIQSTVHEFWVRRYASTLETRLRYIPTGVFETFPFPNPDPQTPIPSLETIGETYHEHRRQLMLDRQEGLTKSYNRFHDPEESAADIVKLRALHVEMDQAVAAAYSWDDLDLGHGFHETPQGLRYTISESARREVLGRLLALNHERYEAEVKAGLHSKKKRKKRSRKGAKAQRKQRTSKKNDGQMSLF